MATAHAAAALAVVVGVHRLVRCRLPSAAARFCLAAVGVGIVVGVVIVLAAAASLSAQDGVAHPQRLQWTARDGRRRDGDERAAAR